MIIRCKRCFKKYDDLDLQCPRCGKVNDREFGNEVKDYSSKKPEVPRSENVNMLYKWFLKKFIRTVNCSFCGTDTNSNFTNCSYCRNSNSEKIDKKIIGEFPDKTELIELANETIEKSDSIIDFDSFNKKLKDKGFKIENWKTPYELKLGKLVDRKIIMGIYSAIAFIFIFFINSEAEVKWINGLLIIIFFLIAGNLLIIPISKVMFTENLRFSKYSNGKKSEISYLTRDYFTRNGAIENYLINSDEIKRIKLEVNKDTKQIENIIIIAKESSNVNQMVFKVDVHEFNGNSTIKLFMLLFCMENDIKLFINKKVIVRSEDVDIEGVEIEEIKKKIVFVRIDTKIEGEELTPVDFEDHIRYLEKIATERYFRGGGFEKEGGGMIIFKAESFEEADMIAKNDPIIVRGKYSYQLKEWNIVLKSDFL